MKRVNTSTKNGSVDGSPATKRSYQLRNISSINSKQTSTSATNNNKTRSAAIRNRRKNLDESNICENSKKTKATNLSSTKLNQNRGNTRLITRSLVAAAKSTTISTDRTRRNNLKQTTSIVKTTKETRATKSKSSTKQNDVNEVDNNCKLVGDGNSNDNNIKLNNNNDNGKIQNNRNSIKNNQNDLVVNGQSNDEDNDDDKSMQNKTTTVTPKRARTKRRYICQFCNKEFLGGNDLRKHVRIHTNERPFECQHCGQKFRQGGCLKNHIASQHGTTVTFTCYYCNKSFPIKERLRLHMRLHSGEKPYQCKICYKRFARGGQLTQHLASHSGIKKYHCTQCSASFSCAVNLKLHLKSHSNVRDFTCHLCGKTFIRPDALKKHLTCYHENVKAFYCSICSRTFKGHLPQHMRTHENVKSHGCANCGATFSQKSQLIVHQRIHSGERPYRCQVCWQAFAHSSVLKLHIRKHTGEKPFKCVLCKDTETAFSQLPHLKTHMRAIHGMDKAYNCEYCSEYFKTKHQLQEHKFKCTKAPKNPGQESNENYPIHVVIEPKCSSKESTLSRMRLLIAVLLKKISSQDRLKQLGFDKRLIDNVLMDALKMAGQNICTDKKLHEVERLRANVEILLDWSIPEAYMQKIRTEKRSTEELLEDLTSNFNREPGKA